ncbi:MAG: hypothetical protein ACJ744_05940 [Gaiellaceae bacterium]
MTATTAGASDQPVDAVRDQSARRLWRGALTFIVYVLTAGLYGIWWFFVSRQEMAEELDRKPSSGVALLEGIGQLIPVVSAYVWYRTITDINAARAKVGAPAVNVWGWIVALAASIPCIYILPEVLGPILDAFNPDMREIIKAVGYATFPAQFLVFGYMVGYWNEYWLEKHAERVGRRALGPVDFVFMALAVVGLVGLVVAAVSS